MILVNKLLYERQFKLSKELSSNAICVGCIVIKIILNCLELYHSAIENTSNTKQIGIILFLVLVLISNLYKTIRCTKEYKMIDNMIWCR
jgi:hypothetical protein